LGTPSITYIRRAKIGILGPGYGSNSCLWGITRATRPGGSGPGRFTQLYLNLSPEEVISEFRRTW
jgi:hypothetical protein